jgi:hypothetical protein
MLPSGSDELAPLIYQYADKYGLNRNVFRALIKSETSMGEDNKGSSVQSSPYIGYGQLSNDVIKRYGLTNPHDVNQNLDASARHLKEKMTTFGVDEIKAVEYYKGVTAKTNPETRSAYLTPFKKYLSEFNQKNPLFTAEPKDNYLNEAVTGALETKPDGFQMGASESFGENSGGLSGWFNKKLADWMPDWLNMPTLVLFLIALISFVVAAVNLAKPAASTFVGGIK